ncbi:acetate--CoA ligase family protein [[Clostridium] hylemonae]|uniref:ATP-grasp domain-containing protein n=1 Tax=[Clostridium] hylemonae DSM 15053 TaxID=553973 RepID=C0BX17_9FIRM|nr:acetate--CoA ligase family protein [[Clostridium] hylemonae]EEG75615.1 hypothetical protein CLOHYLEM_04351 [[Clostridium] hylemonae DSM 15053]QEK17972.1 hypothetical protein LAJLEIBI_01984 [[Clostridium] hylemonae DSM 15053]
MSRFLNELDAKNLLSEYGVPMAKSMVAGTKEEAVRAAEELEFPVVMKILSADIQHKTEAGCVCLGVEKEEVEETYEKILENARSYKADAAVDGVLIQEMAAQGLEVIVGMKKDPQFGPVLMTGSGGIYVEVFQDIALRLLPVDRKEAVRMIKETKLYQIIRGARRTEYDLDALVDSLLKVSELAVDQPSIEEIDINPLFLYEKGKGAKGVDALIKITEEK